MKTCLFLLVVAWLVSPLSVASAATPTPSISIVSVRVVDAAGQPVSGQALVLTLYRFEASVVPVDGGGCVTDSAGHCVLSVIDAPRTWDGRVEAHLSAGSRGRIGMGWSGTAASVTVQLLPNGQVNAGYVETPLHGPYGGQGEATFTPEPAIPTATTAPTEQASAPPLLPTLTATATATNTPAPSPTFTSTPHPLATWLPPTDPAAQAWLTGLYVFFALLCVAFITAILLISRYYRRKLPW